MRKVVMLSAAAILGIASIAVSQAESVVDTPVTVSDVAEGQDVVENAPQKLDPKKLEIQISELMQDEDISNKKGIYEYILTGKEKHLNILFLVLNIVFLKSQKIQGINKL